MKLTRYTDYSLRVLMYLGARPEHTATISEVARAYGISRNHVMKVVYTLGKLGYVRTTRGKGGGLWLARPPDQVNVGTLVREMETSLELAECFGSSNCCAISSVCVLRGALGEALRAFLAVLDGYWLTDLLAPHDDLRRLLTL